MRGGGEAIDIEPVGNPLVLKQLTCIHRMRPGALIRASVLLGGMCCAGASKEALQRLDEYANCIGLAFQIQDDILDVVADTETLGKPQGSDQLQNKPTFPSLLGLDGARERALALHHQAMDCLNIFDDAADTLRQLSAYIVERGH